MRSNTCCRPLPALEATKILANQEPEIARRVELENLYIYRSTGQLHTSNVMYRRLLAVLIALSVSWVTTGYACSMGSARVQPACCCKEAPQQSCPNPSSKYASGAMTGAPSEACCSVVTISGVVAKGQAETPVAPDLPQFASVGRAPVMASVKAGAPTPSRRPARDRSTPHIYILFGHLLR